MTIEQKNRVLAAIHRVDAQNVLPGNSTVSGQTYSYYFLFGTSGISVVRLVYGTVDQIDQYYSMQWKEIREFRIKSGLLVNRLTFRYRGITYSYLLSKAVVGNPWVKENRMHLQSVNYYCPGESLLSADEGSTAALQPVLEQEKPNDSGHESDQDEPAVLDPVSYLDDLRMRYRKQPMTGRKLHKPLWLGQRDALIQIFQDADLLYTSGEIFYGCLVQANSRLFENTDHKDYPATMIYSTDPYFEEHPQDLRNIAQTLYDAKDEPAETLSSPVREIAAILNAETDRSQIEFSVVTGETEHTVRLFSTLVFRDDLPDGCLQGSIYPVLALPERSNAVMILPKEYWSESFIQAQKQDLL